MKPVLVFVSSDKCGFCKKFAPKWETIKTRIGDSNATFVQFPSSRGEFFHAAIEAVSGGWQPGIILMNPYDYARVFTNDDVIPNVDQNFEIRSIKYSAVPIAEKDRHFHPSIKNGIHPPSYKPDILQYEVNLILPWFNRMRQSPVLKK